MQKIGWFVLLTLTMISLVIPANAQTAAPTSQPTANPLIKMLALIPDNADTRPANGQGVSYADYRALEAAQGSSTHALLRLSAGMDLSDLSYFKNSSKVVGFDWSAVDQSIVIGTIPRTALLLAGTFDDKAIGKALAARNFEQSTVNGITVWHRFDDAQINIQAREPSDPFGGHLGLAARITLLPGYIANSRFTDIATQFIDTYNHKQRSLAEADDYRILTAAITDPKTYSGPLIQALFVTPAAFEQSTPPDNIDVSTYGDLPSYSLGVLADRQEGNAQVHLMALFYPDTATAQKASLELGKRITGFDISQMYERLNVSVDEPRVYEDSTGPAVAIVSVHYALPSATPDPNGGPVPTGGLLYRQ